MHHDISTWLGGPLAAAAALALAAAPAWSQGQIDSVQASATRVLVGESVGVGVSWSIAGSFQNGGGSDLVEPAPVEGWQQWMMNWYWTETTTAVGIDLQFAGQTYSERFSNSEGAGASGSWGFNVVFDVPGLYDLGASGSYTLLQTSTNQAEIASRNCYNAGDPDYGVYLVCDSWSYSYPFSQSQSESSGLLNSASLQVEVVAVPEPGTAALWLAGLGVAGLAAARRRRTPR